MSKSHVRLSCSPWEVYWRCCSAVTSVALESCSGLGDTDGAGYLIVHRSLSLFHSDSSRFSF